MATRLGLHSNEAFGKYMEQGGFAQEVHYDEGFLVPVHHYTFVLPHDGNLHVDVMYQMYVMFSCFVRSQMVLDNDSFIVCSNNGEQFVLVLMHYVPTHEEVVSYLKQMNYASDDYMNLSNMGNHEVLD